MTKKIFVFCLFFVLLEYCSAATVKIGENKEFIVNGRQLFPVFSLGQIPEAINYQNSFGVNVFIGVKEPKKGVTVEKYISFLIEGVSKAKLKTLSDPIIFPFQVTSLLP